MRIISQMSGGEGPGGGGAPEEAFNSWVRDEMGDKSPDYYAQFIGQLASIMSQPNVGSPPAPYELMCNMINKAMANIAPWDS